MRKKYQYFFVYILSVVSSWSFHHFLPLHDTHLVSLNFRFTLIVNFDQTIPSNWKRRAPNNNVQWCIEVSSLMPLSLLSLFVYTIRTFCWYTDFLFFNYLMFISRCPFVTKDGKILLSQNSYFFAIYMFNWYLYVHCWGFVCLFLY